MQRWFLEQQCWNNVATIWSNATPMLQRSVTLKIFLAIALKCKENGKKTVLTIPGHWASLCNPISLKQCLQKDSEIQSTLALRTPREHARTAKSPAKTTYELLTEINSRYYGFSLMTLLTRDPYSVRNKGRWLKFHKYNCLKAAQKWEIKSLETVIRSF